jgi:hypothetical protein
MQAVVHLKKAKFRSEEWGAPHQEKKEAEKIAENKRQTAKQEEEAAKGSEDTVKMFRRQAAASRERRLHDYRERRSVLH